MATRPYDMLDKALIITFRDPLQPAFTRGQEVKYNASDDLLQLTAANDPLAIGIVNQANFAGRPVTVCMYGSAVIPVVVGTGGATRGVDAIKVADGFTDAAVNGTGVVSQIIKGKFLQTGVAGDIVGLMIGVNQRSVTA